ncbi:DMT family transporter [Spirulina sp. CS-785/01]|uniref:DMT family transporter n=1 Tax=Spirulina sp. CS-785/01 TaxID=3021716 RepID=UPI00232DDCAC|nr:DMT family transporter [Spirulina sp. CS-785/01]MDB9313514.1 DMT family transporter [Spirulina sp. CS-785/01]
MGFQGEIAALAGAFLWTVAAVIFGQAGVTLSALVLNWLKGVIAIVLLGGTILATQSPIPPFDPLPISFLAASGAISIGVGDTAYLACLKELGPRRALLLETLAPPLSGILAFLVLGEKLSGLAWLGIVLTLLGVAWVISERSHNPITGQNNLKLGLLWAIIAEVGQATGAVLSRAALVNSDIIPLWSTLFRLLGGTLLASLWLWATHREQPIFTCTRRQLWAIGFAAFVGTYLGIWLQQTAFKHSPTGIAQTLLATSPLFVLPFALYLGETVSIRAILGVILALIGISLLFGVPV